MIVRVRGGAEHFLASPATGTERVERGTVVTVVTVVVQYQPPRTAYVQVAHGS